MGSRFVGREHELDQLLSGLAQAQAGEARFAAIEGEPGIGKTRLLRELSDRATDEGCLVLHGRAAEFERELPFGLFVDALDSYLEAAPATAFSTLSTGTDRRARDRVSRRCARSPAAPPTPPRRTTGSASTARCGS